MGGVGCWLVLLDEIIVLWQVGLDFVFEVSVLQMNEYCSSIVFVIFDIFLCDDVCWFGVLVGDLFVEQVFMQFYEDVEQVCMCVIVWCESDVFLFDFNDVLIGLLLECVEVMVWVFSIYFQVVNIVECVYCICCCCDYQCVDIVVLQLDGLQDVLQKFKVQGVILVELVQWLLCIDIELVFIVYFIEVVCCVLLEKEQLMVVSLVDNLDG